MATRPTPPGSGDPAVERMVNARHSAGFTIPPTPPTPDTRPALVHAQDLIDAANRLSKAWNTTQVEDALRSVRFYADKIEYALNHAARVKSSVQTHVGRPDGSTVEIHLDQDAPTSPSRQNIF